MPTFILPYNNASESAASLAKEMRVKRIRREGSKYNYKDGDVIINWGCPTRPQHIPENVRVVNPFEKVAIASNKLTSYGVFSSKGISTPHATSDPEEAQEWLDNDNTIVARTVLNGHGGKGIVILYPGDNVIPAPLYTLYIPKKKEYRVHVCFDKVIDVTRKVLREDYPDKENVNWKVRNHDNGFIFIRNHRILKDRNGNPLTEIDLISDDIKGLAIRAVRALGLDFGAVDIIHNEKHNTSYVLEVNTAPGIADIATNAYADMLRQSDYFMAMNNLEKKKRVYEPIDEMPIFNPNPPKFHRVRVRDINL